MCDIKKINKDFKKSKYRTLISLKLSCVYLSLLEYSLRQKDTFFS